MLGPNTGFGLVVNSIDLGPGSLTGFEADPVSSTRSSAGPIPLVSLETSSAAVKAGVFQYEGFDLGGDVANGPIQPSLKPCLPVGWDPLNSMA
jgi:hypothetical protein